MEIKKQINKPLVGMVRVDQPSEPPAKIKEMTFNSDDNLNSDDLGSVTTDTGKKLETVPIVSKDEAEVDKTVTPKVEDKPSIDSAPSVEASTRIVDDKKKPAVDTIESVLKAPSKEKKVDTIVKGEQKITPITPPEKGGKVQRDYTGYTAEQVNVFKKMSDEAYVYTVGLIKENKELVQHKGTTFFQHPEAYVLDPGYKTMQTDIQFANKEAQYWQQQLIKVKKGEPCRGLSGWDENGNPILEPNEIAPTDDVEEQLRLRMSNCLSAAQNMQGKLQQGIQGYKQRINTDLQTIQQERAKRFSWVADPQYLEYEIDIPGRGSESVKTIRQNFINIFPAYLRTNPATEIAADMMVAMQIQGQMLANATAQREVSETKQEEMKRAEPSSKSKPAPQPDPIGGVSEFKLDGMPM